MSAVPTPPLSSPGAPNRRGIQLRATPDGAAVPKANLATAWHRWWPLGLGLAALVGSTSYRFAQGLWQQPEFEHGPLLLVVTLWLFWRERETISLAKAPASLFWAGALMIAGLLLYLLGVRLKAGYLEFWALVPVLAGAFCQVGGWTLVRKCSLVLLFLVLAAPLPAPVLFYATMGLKEWVSHAAEIILNLASYPVARDGVTLRIGSYNLLVADACSGMNSLISLSAVGLLYVHLTARRPPWHLFILLASILPIAISTNIVRVLMLTLITYHMGDEAGQGFLHEFAGFVMFLVAVLSLALEDWVLGRIFRVQHWGSHAIR